MRKLAMLTAGVAALALAGCASAPSTGLSPSTVQKDLDTAVLALGGIEAAAAVYTALPDCTTTDSKLCSRADIRVRIIAYDQQVRALLDTVRADPALLNSLLAAIQNFRQVVPVG